MHKREQKARASLRVGKCQVSEDGQRWGRINCGCAQISPHACLHIQEMVKVITVVAIDGYKCI
jgi:hypothetical protein